MNETELARLIDELIDQVILNFGRKMSEAQTNALNNLLAEIAKLSTNQAGNIKPTIANLKIKEKIRANANKIIFAGPWTSAGQELAGGISDISKLLNEYLGSNWAFDPGPTFETLVKSAQQTAISTLSEAGLGGRVVAYVDEAINQSITSGAPLRDLIGQFTEYFDRGLEQIGNVNLNQVATDTLGQFNGAYMSQAADRLGLSWFKYIGGTIKSTRDFCEQRDGGYYHKEEIERWPRLNWDGKIAATNSRNIFSFRGGWNCRHKFIPVKRAAVPEKWKVRWREIKAGRKAVTVAV
jgi:hypothetical protein